MKETAFSLSFDALANGRLGISSRYGSFLAEAAAHCLQCNDHSNPVTLFVTGDVCTAGSLKWLSPDAAEGTWSDLQEATEYGAYGVAILIVLRLTDTRQVERSAKGTGVDYWMGDAKERSGIFQRAARLEVSGILRGDETKVAARLAKKLAQTKQSDEAGLPAYVAIVDFGRPEVRFAKRTVEMKS